MHTLARHQLTTPLVGRGRFGLAGPSSFPTLGKDVRPLFDALERLRWRITSLAQIPSRFRTGYQFRENSNRREVLVRLTDKRGTTKERWVSLAAIHDLPVDPNYSRVELVPTAATASTVLRAPDRVLSGGRNFDLIAEFFTLQNTRSLIKRAQVRAA